MSVGKSFSVYLFSSPFSIKWSNKYQSHGGPGRIQRNKTCETSYMSPGPFCFSFIESLKIFWSIFVLRVFSDISFYSYCLVTKSNKSKNLCVGY